MDTWRNRLAWRLASWSLRHVADGQYAAFIAGAIRYGMTAAYEDTLQDQMLTKNRLAEEARRDQ